MGIAREDLAPKATDVLSRDVSLEELNTKVTGPANATSNAIAKFSGVTGKEIQNSGITIDASNNISGANTLTLATTTVAPLTVSSTSLVTNLNADLLDGKHASDFSLGEHNHTLDSLSNVTITSNATGEILKWNGTAWINNTLAEAGISATGHTHSYAPNAFSTIAVSGQSNVVADSTADTLTLVAGTNVTLTTNATNDSVTITSSHPDITAASSVNNSGRTYIQDITLDSDGHVTALSSATESVVDTNTTYSIKASSQTGGAGLDLDAGGSGSGTDTVIFKGGTNVTVSYTDANTITIASTDTNTDTLVTQTVTTTDSTYPILFTNTVNKTATSTDTARFGTGVKINPSTSTISATVFSGNLTGNVTGNVSGSSGSCTGNAATATKLATARTISLTGDVTGSVSFDGSGDAAITATVVDDSHNHVISNVGGLQTALNGKLNILSERSLSVTTTNWVTIATCSTGRAYGEFYVYDADSSRHNMVKIIASASFGQNAVVALCGNRHGARTIAHVRILYNTADRTYGGAKLQVYCESPTFTLRVRRVFTDQFPGWTSWNDVNPVVEGTPSGWAEDSTTRFDDITNTAYSLNGNLSGNATGLKGSTWARVQTDSGYIDFGPANTSTAHIYTDRPSFYFNKGLLVNGTAVSLDGHTHNYLATTGKAADSDKLDGLDSTAFMRRDQGDTAAGSHQFYSTDTTNAYYNAGIQLREVNLVTSSQSSDSYAPMMSFHWGGRRQSRVLLSSDGNLKISKDNGTPGIIWHSSNDGSGSGLDADTLDGSHASSFAASSHTHAGTDVTSAVANATTAASCSGNAATATKLATARTISLTGDVTGSASFDGSANISITSTVANNSHTHTSVNISDATNANTANMIVKRDASGNFSAGAITAENKYNFGNNAYMQYNNTTECIEIVFN